METITIDGLDIDVVQTVTGFTLVDGRLMNRTETGIQWGGKVVLKSGDKQLGNRQIRQAIAENSFMTWEELNETSQSELSKDYADLTVVESQEIQGKVLATKMITGINEAGAGVSVEDVTALVTAVVTALK
jgi:hypothetical protein